MRSRRIIRRVIGPRRWLDSSMKKRKRSKIVKPSRRGTKEDREIYARNFERGIPAFVSSAHYDRDARIMRIKMKRRRKTNPKIQNMFVLIAQKAGGPVLKYIGGIRFAIKGRAVLFPSRKDATTAGREMQLHFPILRGYKLSVKS